MGLLPKNSSLKFKPIPHGFSTESLCFDFVLFFFMRNDTNPHVGNSSDTIVPHSLLHSEDMFLLARKAEIVIQQNLLLIIRAPTSARPSSELIGQFTIYRIGFQNSALVVVRNEKPQISIRIISVMSQRQIDIIPVHGIGNFRCKTLHVPFEPAIFRKGIKLVIHIGSPAGDRASQQKTNDTYIYQVPPHTPIYSFLSEAAGLDELFSLPLRAAAVWLPLSFPPFLFPSREDLFWFRLLLLERLLRSPDC